MKSIKPPPEASSQLEFINVEESSWWATQLSPNALRRLQDGWQGVIRKSLLKAMPAEELGQQFSDCQGRPSKELYSMAGLLLIAEYKNLTIEEAAEAYTYDAGVQYALNLPRDFQYLCPRTVDNYRRRLLSAADETEDKNTDGLAREIFARVTSLLIEELGICTTQQRLDSTHVLSNMAHLKRGQLVAVCVRRFLHQCEKRCPEAYAALIDPALAERYTAVEESRLFGGAPKKIAAKKASAKEKKAALIVELERIGQDIARIAESVSGSAEVQALPAYQQMMRMFDEQFACGEAELAPVTAAAESSDDGDADGGDNSGGGDRTPPKTVTVRERGRAKSTGGMAETLQNPSDPDAGYDGHRVSGADCADPAADRSAKWQGGRPRDHHRAGGGERRCA